MFYTLDGAVVTLVRAVSATVWLFLYVSILHFDLHLVLTVSCQDPPFLHLSFPIDDPICAIRLARGRPV